MYNRILNKPLELGVSFFLFGPRGTGKTTWLRQHFPEGTSVYLDLLDAGLYTELLARPHRLASMIPRDFPGWVVLDEIQRVPSLLNEVHRLIELRGLRFAMTGSSARSLRQKGVNLLAGRALTFHMHALTAAELGDDFDLPRALLFGQLPAAQGSPAAREYLKSYVNTYLREEVQQEGLTRNLGNFTRFLETASFSQANLLNVAHVAREAALDRKVVENYFGILDDLLIARRLPAFNKRAKRRLTSHPKFFFFDVGVYRAIRPRGPLDSPEEMDGASLETLCFQEICAINDQLGLDYELSYWRTSDGTEVDFVLHGPRGLLAFEIKRSHAYARADLNGLKAFRKDYPMATCHLLYGGEQARHEDDIQILPLAAALRNLPTLLASQQPAARVNPKS
jgi:predicted AAA+ superfamily ATPase